MVGEEWHWPERGTSRAPKRSRPTAKGNVLCRTEIHPRFAIHVDPEHQIGRLRAV